MANTGITNAVNNPIINPTSRSELPKATSPRGTTIESIRPGILTLTKFETKCIQLQLSSIESNISGSLGINFYIFRKCVNATAACGG